MISQNQVKFLRSLKMGKFRDLNRVFAIEGVKMVDELINSQFSIDRIFATRTWINSHQQTIAGGKIQIQEVSEEELKKISNLVTPNEVMAVVKYPEKLPEIEPAGDLVLILDKIRDPGNLGTIIRTADWFGIATIFCSEDSADIFNPKAAQASMGSIFRVNVFYTAVDKLLKKLGKSRHIYGTCTTGENIYDAELIFPSAVIIGNESKGISPELMPLLTSKISIPSGSPGAESLNASIAAGIVMSEFRRRKRES